MRGKKGSSTQEVGLVGSQTAIVGGGVSKAGCVPWPQAVSGAVHLSAAQLAMLLEGIDWRRPKRVLGRGVGSASRVPTEMYQRSKHL